MLLYCFEALVVQSVVSMNGGFKSKNSSEAYFDFELSINRVILAESAACHHSQQQFWVPLQLQ